MGTEAGKARLRRAEMRQGIQPQDQGGDVDREHVEAPPSVAAGPPSVVDQDDEAIREPISGSEHGGDQDMDPEEEQRAVPKPQDTPMDHVDAVVPVMSVADSRELKAKVKQHWMEIFNLVDSVGGCPRAYNREKTRQIRNMVPEIYSPAMVTAAAKLLPSLGISPGFSLDLTELGEIGRPGTSTSKSNVKKHRRSSSRRIRCYWLAAQCAQRPAHGNA